MKIFESINSFVGFKIRNCEITVKYLDTNKIYRWVFSSYEISEGLFMYIDGKWYSEPEIRSYIQQLKNQIQQLQEQLKNPNSKKGEV